MDGFRARLYRFMAGRRGMDDLNLALYLFGLAAWLINLFLRLGLLSLLSMGAWAFSIFRSLSRNIPARERENSWFLGWFTPLRRRLRAAYLRFKNRRVYKYFRCPKCKSLLKLPRNIGEKVVTCSACGTTFKKKA